MSGDESGNIPEDEKLVECPYNKLHFLKRSRFGIHLRKCVKSYCGPEMKTCPMNNLHIVLATEMDDHFAECPNRVEFEKQIESFQPMKEKTNNDGPDANGNKRAHLADDDEEEGYEEKSRGREFISIEERKRRCLESNKIVHFQHGTKSQRKAERAERFSKIVAKEQLSDLSD